MDGTEDELRESCRRNKLTPINILEAIRKEKEEVRFEVFLGRKLGLTHYIIRRSYQEKKLAAETK